jgi:hypothetical protein
MFGFFISPWKIVYYTFVIYLVFVKLRKYILPPKK